MLCLARKVNESVILRLPDGREITVCYCKRKSENLIVLGVDAPPEIYVYRSANGDKQKNRNSAPLRGDLGGASGRPEVPSKAPAGTPDSGM